MPKTRDFFFVRSQCVQQEKVRHVPVHNRATSKFCFFCSLSHLLWQSFPLLKSRSCNLNQHSIIMKIIPINTTNMINSQRFKDRIKSRSETLDGTLLFDAAAAAPKPASFRSVLLRFLLFALEAAAAATAVLAAAAAKVVTTAGGCVSPAAVASSNRS